MIKINIRTLICFLFSSALMSEIILQDHGPSPIWYRIANKEALSKTEKIDLFRTVVSQLGSTENDKIPLKSDKIIRIATYNVHAWLGPWRTFTDSFDDDAYKNMLKVIKFIDSDVLILQEVGNIKNQHLRKDFKEKAEKLGYVSMNCCDTGPLQNCILSKLPVSFSRSVTFNTNPGGPRTDINEQRCFVRTKVTLPSQDSLTVYATHLEERNLIEKRSGNKISSEDVRLKQMKELLNHIKINDSNNNVVIGADFNAIREQDMQYNIGQNKVLNLYRTTEIERLGSFTTPQALNYATKQGFIDSFEKTDVAPPFFTVWSGSRIDLLLVNKKWKLPLSGSYVFYSWASDHLPVIMDISVK